MIFEVTPTKFGNALGEKDGHFARSVSNKIVSYVAYFSESGTVYRLEMVVGEQYSIGEAYETEDVEAYLTAETKDVTAGLNKALFVLREFVQQYQKKIGKEVTVRFVTYDTKTDEQVNQFIESAEFMQPMTIRTFKQTVISRLLDEKKATDEEISRPARSKYATNPDAFEYGQHIKHFEDTAKGLLGNGSVINLPLGRLNDDGGDYDTVVLSGDKTGVDILHGPSKKNGEVLRSLISMGRII